MSKLKYLKNLRGQNSFYKFKYTKKNIYNSKINMLICVLRNDAFYYLCKFIFSYLELNTISKKFNAFKNNVLL